MRFPFHILKLIGQKAAQAVKQASLLPEAVAANYRRRHHQTEVDELEAERLDRIRHPWKYLGK